MELALERAIARDLHPDSPDLASDGSFLDEDVVESAGFANDQRQWAPSSPLYAGHYWWLVWSSDRTTSQSYYSAPGDFTVPVSLTLSPVKTVRSTFLHLLALRSAGPRTCTP